MSACLGFSLTVDGEEPVTATVNIENAERWKKLETDLDFGAEMGTFMLSALVGNLVTRVGTVRAVEMLTDLATLAGSLG